MTRRRSIRATLLWVLVPAGSVFMVAAWVVHEVLLERMTRQFVEQRLRDEAAFLERRVRTVGAEGDADAIAPGAYFQEIFHHAFALRVGERVIKGPERWHEALDALLNHDATGLIAPGTLPGEGAGDLVALRRVIDRGDDTTVIVVAQDLASLRASQQSFHWWTAAVFGALLVLLALAIWLAVRLSLRSVDQLGQALAELRDGRRERLDVASPHEFHPLIEQINQLLDSLDQRLQRSREALANLSHSLKTPITAVQHVLEEHDRPLDEATRHQLAERLGSTLSQLEAEMRRSRFAGAQAGKSACPVSQTRDLIWMLERLYPDRELVLATELDEEARWPIEEQDFNEVLGNLLDNGAKWARNLVRVEVAQTTDWLEVRVSDDGPGVAPDQRDALGTRGVLLDEQTSGHGLGLAIVREVTQRYGGGVRFQVAELGGLGVVVWLPRVVQL